MREKIIIDIINKVKIFIEEDNRYGCGYIEGDGREIIEEIKDLLTKLDSRPRIGKIWSCNSCDSDFLLEQHNDLEQGYFCDSCLDRDK